MSSSPRGLSHRQAVDRLEKGPAIHAVASFRSLRAPAARIANPARLRLRHPCPCPLHGQDTCPGSRRLRISCRSFCASAGSTHPSKAITVRGAVPSDWDRFKSLWDQYCVFYDAEVPLDVTQHTWERCLDAKDDEVMCLVADIPDGPGVIGFATGIVHASTFSKSDMLYLEDLFVSPEARGRGAASALINRMKAIVEERGYRKLYWHTLENNQVAQSLYNKLAEKTDFIRYDSTGGGL